MKAMDFDNNRNSYKAITFYDTNGIMKTIVLSHRELKMAEMRAEQWQNKLNRVL